MDISQLEYILAIAEEGNLLRASEKLFISPSALSQFVSKLETALQTSLFVRNRHGWIPTPAGNIYIDMARDVIDRRRKAYTEMSLLSEHLVSNLTVGITPGRGTYMFSKIFPAFNAKYPNIKITLVENSVNIICDCIAHGSIDIGFLTSGFANSDLETISLVTERFLMVVPKSHPLAALADKCSYGDYATVTLSQFRDDEFILMGAGTTLRSIEDEMFRKAGFVPKISFETSSMLTITSLSQNGFGIAFVPQFYAKYSDQAVYFSLDPPVTWDLTAVYRRGSKLTLAEEYLISTAKDFYKSTPYMQE